MAFSRAWQLVHRPRVLLNLATAQIRTGHLVEGAENYRLYLREAGEDADDRLATEARERLAEVERRTPQLTVLAPALGRDDTLTLDGTSLSRAVLSAPLPVDPGDHDVRVLRDGSVVTSGQITLGEGDHETLRLDVPAPAAHHVPDPTEAAQQATIPADPLGRDGMAPRSEDQPSDSGGALRSPWLWIVVGLALGGGVAAGVLLTRDTGQGPFQGNIGPGYLEVQ